MSLNEQSNHELRTDHELRPALNSQQSDRTFGVNLTFAQRRLYEELERLSRLKGYAWISNSTLAEKYGVSERTITRWMARLEIAGLIQTERTRRSRKVKMTHKLLVELPEIDKMSINLQEECLPQIDNVSISDGQNVYLRQTECLSNINITMNEKEKEEIQRIFDAWKTVLDHPQSKLDEKRTKIIAQRLKEFSADELCRVFEGAKRSPFHMGQNDRARKYDDIRILFRDAEQVEKFLELAKPPSTVLNKPPVLDDYDRERLANIGKDRKYR